MYIDRAFIYPHVRIGPLSPVKVLVQDLAFISNRKMREKTLSIIRCILLLVRLGLVLGTLSDQDSWLPHLSRRDNDGLEASIDSF
jgi:hypothetical protein